MADKPNIYQRLLKVMEEVTYIQKDQKSGMKYSIVSHDVVTAKVRPALMKHGILYHPSSMEWSQEGNRTQVRMSILFINTDNPDDCFAVPSLGFGIDNQDKGPGKAISYAVKYALLKALALETGDDPDLDQKVVLEPSEQTKAALGEYLEEIKHCNNKQDLNGLGEELKAKHRGDLLKYNTSTMVRQITEAMQKKKAELASTA